MLTTLLVAALNDTNHSIVAKLDWTSIVLGVFTSITGMFAAWMAKQAAYQSRQNNLLLATNSGKTIGQHIEKLQEDQIVLRDELQKIAREKLKADATLAAASLQAIAKLTAAADVNMQETALQAASDLTSEAETTASKLIEDKKSN